MVMYKVNYRLVVLRWLYVHLNYQLGKARLHGRLWRLADNANHLPAGRQVIRQNTLSVSWHCYLSK